MSIPTDARRELYGLQVICAGTDNSYVNLMWARREKENPRNAKASDGWPVAKSVPAKVTRLKVEAK